jgi:hypothetical protein
VKLVTLLALRGWLSWYTTILGTAIGLLVLTTGALRNAIVNAHGGQDGRFAPEGVLLYGAFFSVLLASIYIPAYLALTDAGQRMRDRCFPLSRRWENAEAWAAWYRQRKDFEEFLGLRLGTVASLRGVVGVLTPLASSAVSLLLGKG